VPARSPDRIICRGAQLVQAIGELADVDAHHPDVDLRHDGVTVRLVTINRERVQAAIW
jgi:pterin-4a-carbinolamine dehydratase